MTSDLFIDISGIKAKLDRLLKKAVDSFDNKDLDAFQFACGWHWEAISRWLETHIPKVTEAVAQPQPIVIVHFDERGDVSYLKSPGVRLLIVDERSPHDRVYDYLTESPESAFSPFLACDIGSSKDGRHDAIKRRLEAEDEGRSHLEPVK
jgi:hypothetical protein